MKSLLFGKKKLKVNAVVSGELIELSRVSDEVFAKKMMGDGYAVEPDDTTITAPFDGKIAFVFPTKHAVGLIGESGVEVLIHVGIDTVELKGEGFESLVSEGQEVKAGHPLLKVDFEGIMQKGYSKTTMVVVTNSALFDMNFMKVNGNISAGDPVLELKLK